MLKVKSFLKQIRILLNWRERMVKTIATLPGFPGNSSGEVRKAAGTDAGMLASGTLPCSPMHASLLELDVARKTKAGTLVLL